MGSSVSAARAVRTTAAVRGFVTSDATCGPGQDVVDAGARHVERRTGAAEEGGEAFVVDHGHGPASSRGSGVPGGGQGGQGGVGRQAAAGLVEAGLDRSGAPSDGERNVPFAQVGVVTQDDGHAQRHREPLQRGQHRLGRLPLLGPRLGAAARLLHMRQRPVTGAVVAVGDLAAELGVARVDDDPVEPGPDARHAPRANRGSARRAGRRPAPPPRRRPGSPG